jgi:hypothetical protein
MDVEIAIRYSDERAALRLRKNVEHRLARQPHSEVDTMSDTAIVAPGKAPSMGTFERYLTLWVAFCIVVGIVLGQTVPGVFHALSAATATSTSTCRSPCWSG